MHVMAADKAGALSIVSYRISYFFFFQRSFTFCLTVCNFNLSNNNYSVQHIWFNLLFSSLHLATHHINR